MPRGGSKVGLNRSGKWSSAALAKQTGKVVHAGKAGLTEKIKRIVDVMIQQGLNRIAAAKLCGTHRNVIYKAFQKEDVRRYYETQLEIFRKHIFFLVLQNAIFSS